MRTDDPWTCLLPDGGTIRDPSAPEAARDAGTVDVGVVVDTGVDASPIEPVDAGDESPADSGCSFDPFCREDTFVSCRAGSVEEDDCVLGCDGMAGRCRVLVPSNLPEDICERAARSFELIVTSGTERVIDTSTDCELIVPQEGAPDLCVHLHRNIRVETEALLRAAASVPTVSRALVLVAADEVHIAGRVDASWQPANAVDTSGPGRDGAGAVTEGAGGDSTTYEGGGGGGSFGTRGGRSTGVNGALAGEPYGTNALVPLVGGSRGGSAATTVGSGATGGGAGGALQIVACGSMRFTGVISANGAGGQGGQKVASPPIAEGAGGGTGGAVLLEAPTFTDFTGTIVANGGGGGGAIAASVPGSARTGEAGRLDGERAQGGAGNRGTGGLGASVTGPATGGTSSAGGGGGAGRIRINAANATDVTAATISPTPSLGVVEAR